MAKALVHHAGKPHSLPSLSLSPMWCLVYGECRQGISRSATMTIAYLMTYGNQPLAVQPLHNKAAEEEDEEEEADSETLPTAAVSLPASSSSLSLATLPSPSNATSVSTAVSRSPSGAVAAVAQQASVATSSALPVSSLAMSYDQALNFVQSRRPAICPNDGFRAQLRQYEDRLRRRGRDSAAAAAAAAVSSERRV